jgi:hypothetical protein
MSLMSRAGLLGAVSGAATKYNQIQDEQRKKDMEFESQDRLAGLEERRAARLREFQIQLQKQKDAAAQQRTEATIAADKNKPIPVSSGTDVIDASGNVLYKNDDRTASSGSTSKGTLVVMKNGEQKTEDDIRKMYAQQFVSKGLDGFEKKDPNAPDYMQWRNDMVEKDYRLDSSIILDADMTTPPTPGEEALAKARLNEKANWYIPFDNDSNDAEAIAAEVYKMRQEKQQHKRGLMERSSGNGRGQAVADPLGIRQ